MKILQDIVSILQANGVSNIFYSSMPDSPDEAVCVYEYPGSPPTFDHNEMGWENQAVQVVARSKVYDNARNKIETVFQSLASITNFAYNGKTFMRVSPLQSPFPIGPDANARFRLAVNFDVAVRA